MESQYKCQFCEKIFSSKGNLVAHITKAKYCISKRTIETSIKTIEYKCGFCSKSFSSNHFLVTHQQKCNHKIVKYFLI